MHNKTKHIGIVAVLTLIVISLFGCTRSSKRSAPKDKVYRMSIESKVPSLDPSATTDLYSAQVQSLAYETLYEYHYLKRPFQLVPILAESMPQMSADKKTLTIKLKKGVHFQDDVCFAATQGKGREFVADDVVYMFHHAAEPKQSSPTYGLFEDNIVGINDFHTGKSSTITGVRVIDPHTIEIKLTKSLPRFIYNFTDVKSAIMAKECVEYYKDGYGRHPVGTGAFKITQADLGNKIIAVRNPNYTHVTYPTDGNVGDREKGLLEDAGKQLPLVDRVEIEINAETQPAFLKFRNGEFEFTAIPKDYMPSVIPNGKLSEEYSKLGIQHFRETKGDVTVHIFNLKDPVWGKKKELRQAYALALDVPKIIEIQYSGQAIRAQSIIDPTQYGYDPTFKSRWEKRDVAKAKELLAKAGYPDGKGLPPMVTPSASSTIGRHLDELLTRQLAEVGIVYKPEPMTWPEMMQRKQNGNFVGFGMGYSSSVPDVDDVTGIIQTKSIAIGQNVARYSNPEIDTLSSEIEAMENGPARLAKIRKMQEILDDELPMIAETHRIGNQLVQPWVKNYVYADGSVVGQFFKYRKVLTSAEMPAEAK